MVSAFDHVRERNREIFLPFSIFPNEKEREMAEIWREGKNGKKKIKEKEGKGKEK